MDDVSLWHGRKDFRAWAVVSRLHPVRLLPLAERSIMYIRVLIGLVQVEGRRG